MCFTSYIVRQAFYVAMTRVNGLDFFVKILPTMCSYKIPSERCHFYISYLRQNNF